MNTQIATHAIEQLLLSGIKDFCICAGGRNVPLIALLSTFKKPLKLNLYEFFDERSASFFALGRAKSAKKPVVVVTTSGTAVAETLPAMIEAKYSNTPLVILSADRPKSYRNAYTPQTMNQVDIFNCIKINKYDLDKKNFLTFNFLKHTYKQSHINICFEDPIMFKKNITVNSKLFEGETKLCGDSARRDVEPQSFVSPSNNLESADYLNKLTLSIEETINLSKFFSKVKKPVVIVSKLGVGHRLDLIQALLKLNAFVYLESGSRLKGERKLELLSLKAGEVSLQEAFSKGFFDSIIKIGATPTLKFWRLLENKFNSVPVLSIVEHGASGLSRVREILNLKAFLNSVSGVSLSSLGISGSWGLNTQWKQKLRELDEKHYAEKKQYYLDNPFLEKTLVKKMAETFLPQDNIFLGNSLSIRHWDELQDLPCFLSLESNRGLNGIDGLVSSFLGWVSSLSSENKSWAILGDLSSLYDLNALWINKQLKNKNWAIIIINNSGGKIFQPLFNQPILESQHNLNFQNWAKMFDCSYTKVEAKNFSKQFNPNLQGIVELLV